MHQLLRTSKDADHYHIVYIDAAQGVAQMSIADGHTHVIQPVTDPQTQAVTWQIDVQPDGHTHTLQNYIPKPVVEKQDDEVVVSETVSLFKASTELDSDNVKSAEESDEFYCGKQWDDNVRSELEANKRACLTINVTQRQVDELCGHQRQLRTDLHFLPTGDGDQRVCDILNRWSKIVLEQCYYEREESKVFEDGVIRGRGAFNLYVDFSKDFNGEAKVEHWCDRNVSYGPHEKEDLSDCEYLTKHRMYSMAKIKALWPDAAENIESNYNEYVEAIGKPHDQFSVDQYLESQNRTAQSINSYAMVDIAKKEFRVLEQHRKVYFQSAILYDQVSEEVFPLFGWKKADTDAAALFPNVKVIKKVITKIRIVRICGSTLLSDEHPADLPSDDFHIVPLYAHKRSGKWWGKVEIAKDPQREINKRTSQSIDIGNRCASYGWFYDQTTFPEGEKSNFLRNASTPGFTQEVTSTDHTPVQVEGTKFPSEIVNLQQMALELHASLLNIAIAPDEGGTPGEILQRQRLKLVGNEFLFDNLSFTKKKMGRLLVAICQKYYTPERIWRMICNAHNRQPVTIGGEPFDEFDKSEFISLLQTADLSQYDVIVSESQWSPSERIAVQMMLKDMDAGPEVIIPLSDIPEAEKSKILQGIQAQQASQQATEDRKSQTEIQKTLIGQGLFPPKVLAEQGLNPDGTPAQPVQTLPNNQGTQGPQGLAGM